MDAPAHDPAAPSFHFADASQPQLSVLDLGATRGDGIFETISVGYGTPQALEVTADVSLGEDKAAGGFKLTGIKLTVRGEVEGLDDAGFKDAAEKAKAGCPISKALTGVDITLDAALES
jgi:hypothetical protein